MTKARSKIGESKVRVGLALIYALLGVWLFSVFGKLLVAPWLVMVVSFGTLVMLVFQKVIFQPKTILGKYLKFPQGLIGIGISLWAGLALGLTEIFLKIPHFEITWTRILAILALSIWIYPWILAFLMWLEKGVERWRKKEKPKKPKVAIWWISLIIMVGIWLLYLIAFNPAGLSSDSIDTIKQVTGEYALSSGHPLLYTLIIKLFWTIYAHPSLVCVGQILGLGSLAASFFYFLYKQGLKPIVIYIAAAVFAVFPATGTIVVTIWKDGLFTIGVLWTTFLLMQMVFDKERFGRSWVKTVAMILALLIMVLTRHNGIVAFWGTILAIGFFYWRRWTAQILITIGGAIALLFLFNGPLHRQLNVIENVSHAKYTTLVHGIGSVIATDGDLPTDVETMALSIAPQKIWTELYNPYTMGTYQYGEAMPYLIYYQYAERPFIEIVEQYWRSFLTSPRQIIRDRLQLTSIVWEINTPPKGYIYRHTDWEAAEELGLKHWSNKLTDDYVSTELSVMTLDAIFWRVGIYNVALLIIGFFWIVNKKSQYLISLIPWLGNILLLMLICFSQDYRYVHFVPVICFFVFLTAITLRHDKN